MQAPTPLAPMPRIDVILSEADLMARVDALADRLVPRLTGDWTAVSILIGATPFTSDLMKALARRGVHPVLDVLWLESYRDARESSGRVVVRAHMCAAACKCCCAAPHTHTVTRAAAAH